MKRREFLVTSVLGSMAIGAARHPIAGEADASSTVSTTQSGAMRKILIAGGGFNTAFIRYMATLTGKPRPRLCYLPTASADSQSSILGWYRSCAPLNVEALVQESFIASPQMMQSWEERFLSMDGIVCSGGN